MPILVGMSIEVYMDINGIASRLAEERERLGYSQAAFARLLDISREGLRKAELGKTVFKVDILAAAAQAGVDAQYVLTGIRSGETEEIQKKIGIEQQVVQGDFQGVQFAEKGSHIQFVQTKQHTTKTIAKTEPGREHISLEQRAALQELVKEIVQTEEAVKRNPKSFRAVWSALNSHCKVPSYSLIHLDDFEKAELYLRQWLGRLNSSATARNKDTSAWRKKRYAYIKTNSKDPAEKAMIEAYLWKNFQVTSLTELSSEELDKVYRYVAGRKRRR